MEEVRLHDPRMALDGKADGLYFYRAIYNLGIMSLTDSATWFADAILIIVALPLG